MLHDPARFSGGNASFANGVEEGGFSVVDVTHDGYYGRSGGEIFWIIFVVGYAEFEGGIFHAVILLTKGVLR